MKLIKVSRISTEQLERLNAKGFTVMVTIDKKLKGLEQAALKALKAGDHTKVRQIRLVMLKTLQRNKLVSSHE